MAINAKKILATLSSVKLTLVILALSIGLVLLGTLAQVKMGTFAAQKTYFDSWWLVTRSPGFPLPYFPGGLTVGVLWIVNLVAAFADRFHYRQKEAGILLSHFGVILLLLGQCVTQMLARETHLPIEIGQTRNFSESIRDTELAIVMTSDPSTDVVTRIPYRILRKGGTVNAPALPFTLVIREFYPNAELTRAAAGAAPVATQGVGTQIQIQSVPETHSDDETNNVTAVVEVLTVDNPFSSLRKSAGTWLLSTGLGAAQSFTVGGKTFEFYIRPRRQYFPFQLTLKDFRHDIYPGTDIPKNFSSLVYLSNPETGESREALIYMNHPLRYQGKTFYQSSFGKDDRLSVFQVVENPVAWAPYLACSLVIVGLILQFLMHLTQFLRTRV